MKTKFVAIALATAVLTGCGGFGSKPDTTVYQPEGNTTSVKDETTTVGLVHDEGIKVYYTLLGDVKKVVVLGAAPTWKGNVELVAELDAKARLTKFLYDEKVETRASVEVITRTLDKARDNALNTMHSSRPLEFDAEEIGVEVATTDPAKLNAPDTNTSRRIAERIEDTLIKDLTRITSGGTLRAVRKVGSEMRDDGKTYVAVYEWSKEEQKASNRIKELMFK